MIQIRTMAIATVYCAIDKKSWTGSKSGAHRIRQCRMQVPDRQEFIRTIARMSFPGRVKYE